MGERIPPWPGHLISLGDYEVFVREAPAAHAGAEPALYVHGLGGSAADWTYLMALLGGHATPTEPRENAAAAGHAAHAAAANPAGGGRRDRAVPLDGHAVDLPGCGLSPPPPDRRYTISAYARAVALLIERGGRGPVHLFGNSLGGAVCIRVAARWPGLVRTLTLISPALPDLRPRVSTLRFPRLVAPALASMLLRRAQLLAAQTRALAPINVLYFRGHPGVSPHGNGVPRISDIAMISEPERTDVRGYAGEALVGSVCAVMMEYFRRGPGSLWHDAAQVEAPVLALFGSRDALVDHRIARKIGSGFPNGRAVVLMRTGHVAQLEVPQTVAHEVTAFLRECGRAAAPAKAAS
jgi:pimeloyl-ACP methyl ester carboxylesterase